MQDELLPAHHVFYDDCLMGEWNILRRLGTGGMGEVYLAHNPTGESVAVKVLTNSADLDPSIFQREAELLLKIRHPAIASVLGYEVKSETIFGQNRGPCFWMEYVEGQGILSLAKYSKPSQIMDWFRQALEALKELHAQDILHNDLSPQNLMITTDGRVKILDFGLATAFGASQEIKAGTLPYLAPERLSGMNLPAGDIFSLGTIFYEALAGTHPRKEAKNLQDLLRHPALPLAERVPQLENRFGREARVIDRMIRGRMDERFAHVRDIFEALKGPVAARPTAPFHSAVMLGSEKHFEKLIDSRKSVKERSRLLWLHGISGVGKDRFLREASFKLATEGFSVQEIFPENFEALLRESLEKDSPKELNAYLFKNLEETPFHQLGLLFSVRRELSILPGRLFLFEWNDDRLPLETRRFLDNALRWPDSEEILLKNLPLGQTRQLVHAALGETAAQEISEVLQRQSGGNPRVLLDLVNYLREKGMGGKRFFAGEALAEIQNLRSVSDVAIHRLSYLTGKEKPLLAALAAAKEPVDALSLSTFLHDLSEFPRGEDEEGLSEVLSGLIDRDLVAREEDGSFRLSTADLAESVWKGLSSEEKTDWHRRWFDSLRDRSLEDKQRLQHAHHLGEKNYLLSAALPVIQGRQRSGKRDDALQIIQMLLPVIQDPSLRSQILRVQANLFQEMSRFPEALEAAEASYSLQAADEPGALKTAKYLLVTGLLHQHLGHFSESVQRFLRCLEHCQSHADSDLIPYQVRSLTLLGMEALRSGKPKEAEEFFQKALPLAGIRGRRRAELCRNLAISLAKEGNWERAKSLFQESRNLYQEDKFPAGEFATILEAGNYALQADRPEEAEAFYFEAEALAKRTREELSLGLVWNNLGVLQRKKMKLDASLEYLDKAQEIFRSLGHSHDLAEHLTQHALTLTAAGRFDLAEQEMSELRTMAGVPLALNGAAQIAGFLEEFRDGILAALPELSTSPSVGEKYWNREMAIRVLARLPDRENELRAVLKECYAGISVPLQVTFAERFDYQKWILSKIPPKTPSSSPGGNAMNILETLSAISRDLLRETDMDKVFSRLMDAALSLSRAENGFLLLKSGETDGPIEGFSVVVARHLRKEDLNKMDFAVSLSAIRQAMETAEPVVTDNALTDPRFSQAKSVRLHELKSILALPLNGPEGVLGVFYLDHRFEMGLFSDDLLLGLKAFADQAALAVQKAGMIEELKKSNVQLSHQVEEQGEQLHQMERELSQSRLKLKHEYSEIVGRSPRMVQVLGLVDKITDSKIPVWIFGESGTGKESIARALHFNSSRTKAPFVSENCSALPETLLESELFGHKRGAFTHADRDKKGILQYADRGTIFLDEIADMSLNLQAKLLRFLQEGEIRPLGSNEVLRVDVRVVSASNKDLPQLVEEGKFREDLFFRLNGITVTLPPLRERREDIPILAEHFLKKIAARDKQKACRLHSDALRTFLNYPWPGNIRELQNTVETAVLFAEKGTIGARALQFKPALFTKRKSAKYSAPVSMAREAMDPEMERILSALRDQGYHKGNAARALGISRRNLYSKLEKHGVPLELQDLRKFIDEKLV